MFNNALAHAVLGDAGGQLILLSDIVMSNSATLFDKQYWQTQFHWPDYKIGMT